MAEVAPMDRFGHTATDLVARVVDGNAETAAAAARLVVAASRAERLVYAAGAGHSLGGVLEMFFRAGGLPFVSPLWHPDVLPLNGAARSTQAERRVGLGRSVAEASGMGPGDVVVVFSNSGINPYPVEIAAHAREAGAAVVAVTSPVASAAAPLRAGARLMDLADVVLDTCVPPGDVSWPPEAPRVAPLSSMANALCWNMIVATACDLDPDLPTWQSANSGGTDDHNDILRARYAPSVPTM